VQSARPVDFRFSRQACIRAMIVFISYFHGRIQHVSCPFSVRQRIMKAMRLMKAMQCFHFPRVITIMARASLHETQNKRWAAVPHPLRAAVYRFLQWKSEHRSICRSLSMSTSSLGLRPRRASRHLTTRACVSARRRVRHMRYMRYASSSKAPMSSISPRNASSASSLEVLEAGAATGCLATMTVDVAPGAGLAIVACTPG